ncbi:MAG: hypothetical protein APF81_10065 [Desulfosporosinus sp. BRH_c37]|nr:MAG: hypothetical protein APF81_10065 [Desulfosporosinus sp. BRH_c37]
MKNAKAIKSKKIILFNQKQMCCGCEACVSACTKQAIAMESDDYGFLYPTIDKELCIFCGICKKVCAFQNVFEGNEPKVCYVACNKNEKQLGISSSGGAFSAIATDFLENGGVVFGATLDKESNNKTDGERELVPKHIAIHELKDMVKLQGSKYVQSHIGDTYKEVKNYLLAGRRVLFSGTPCQIAGLKAFLHKKYEDLLTVDIICHGVPNADFFKTYLSLLEKEMGGKIIDFEFRDKTKGWKSMIGKATVKMKWGGVKTKTVYGDESSYYNLFLKGLILRESCYECKYACRNRPADITIGDYWGIEHEHSEILSDTKGPYSVEKGISCIIVNTADGIKWIQKNRIRLHLVESTFEKIGHKNGNLYHPCTKPQTWKNLMDIYSKEGYIGVDKYFYKKMGMQIYFKKIKNCIPRNLKNAIKNYVKSS